MGTLALTLPTVGQTPNSLADPEVVAAFQAIQTLVNGNIDPSNVSAALAQAAGVNQAAQKVKGAVNIPGSETVTNTAYQLMPTPDQVTNVVLPANGLIAVWYQATWQESVGGAARAAIFIGANQLRLAQPTAVGTQAAATAGSSAGHNAPLSSSVAGLVGYTTDGPDPFPGDVTTGQVLGVSGQSGSFGPYSEINGVVAEMFGNNPPSPLGGPCSIFAAAGTYTVSVQFKASSGSVSVTSRKLWVQALSFA